jgi:alanine racemase
MSIATSQLLVDLGAYAYNLREARKRIPEECKIMAVVKANAYGHGAVPVARKAIEFGAAMLGVATVEEGISLRKADIHAPILVLVQPSEEALGPALNHGLRLTISNTTIGDRLGDLARRMNKVVPIHCKIDSGMGRQGFDIEGAAEELLSLTRISHIDIEGICTHFPTANIPADGYTQNQVRSFRHLLRQLDKQGIPYEMVHAANSAAIVNFPASYFDMVRPGIMSYGVWPVDDTPPDPPLRQVARWETSIVLIKEVRENTSLGYGRTYQTTHRMRCALAPVGYGDGYPFSLSNKGEVLIHGARCPIRGRVSMDQIIIDVTNVPSAAVGDPVVLMGSDGAQRITAEELAQRAGTIPYEILTGIAPRVARVYTE